MLVLTWHRIPKNKMKSTVPTNIPLTGIVDEILERLTQQILSQAELWKKVPFLALEANGRSGYSDDWNVAYQHGYWALRDIRTKQTLAYIDCENGKLRAANECTIENTTPSKRDLLIILADLKMADAEAVVENLQQQSTRPHSSGYDPDQQEEWRKSQREKYGVEETYRRRTVVVV